MRSQHVHYMPNRLLSKHSLTTLTTVAGNLNGSSRPVTQESRLVRGAYVEWHGQKHFAIAETIHLSSILQGSIGYIQQVARPNKKTDPKTLHRP